MTPAAKKADRTQGRQRTLLKPVHSQQREKTRALLQQYAKTRNLAVRDQLVELNANLVNFIARRFANRGEPLEDIEQVGFMGLIHAIDRFDPSLENEFSTFATPTIMGEIRRYFRDRSWAVRVPRRLQENYLKVTGARDKFSTEHGHPPTVAELAKIVDLSPDEVLAALEVAPAHRAISLESSIPRAGPGAEGDLKLGERIGRDDANLERVEMSTLLKQAMAHLTPREREIMALRFIDELSQTEVAEKLGISQMHVSRLQRAATEQLKGTLSDNN